MVFQYSSVNIPAFEGGEIMRNRPVALCLIYMVLFMLLVMVSCTNPMDTTTSTATPTPAPTSTPTSEPTETPVQEQYEYKQREKVCFFPSFTNENEKDTVSRSLCDDACKHAYRRYDSTG